jgi:tetratricopeptide (TPR) repeat protein
VSDRASLASSIFSVNLGITGMRDVTADMTSGGMYALHVRTSSARFSLLASCLQNALATGLPCTVITGSAPADVLQRLEQSSTFSVAELLASNQLMVFSSQDEFSKNMFRYGPQRLFRELENFGVPERSFLIFDQADELLSLHDLFLASQQIKAISAWFKARQVTALATFCRSNEQRIEALNALLDDLSGLARLGGDKDGIELTFTYWRSSEGIIAAKNFRLYIEQQGNYAVSRRGVERTMPIEIDSTIDEPSTEPLLGLADLSFPELSAIAPTPSRSKLHSDQQHYVYTDPDLDALKESIDGYLHKVESLVDVLHACLGQTKSVVILSIESVNDVKELAKTIHLLRKSLGATSQIVIREKAIEITAAQKQLFMHCGANAVIGKETAISQYPNFLNAIRNQKYSKEIEPLFESILARMPLNENLMATSQAPFQGRSVQAVRNQSFNYKGSQTAAPVGHKVIEKAKRSSIGALGTSGAVILPFLLIFFFIITTQPLVVMAQPNNQTTTQTTTQVSTAEVPLPVAPFQYVPSPRWKEPDASETINRSPAQKNVAELFKQAKYSEVAAEGMQLLTKEKVDDPLQLMIANSLAWTGKTKEAGQLYRVLLTSKYKAEATLGLANLHRWQGRDHLALPMYKEILSSEPDNKDAIEGLRLSNRETRPRTTVTMGGLQDSSNVNVRSMKLNHRWADETLANVWEVETATVQSRDPFLGVTRPSATVRYKAQETPFKPRLEMGSDGKNLYGNVGISLGSLPVLIDIGRVNWGEISNNPKGLNAQLAATRISVQTNAALDIGNLFARAEVNNISDGNRISATAIRFTPAWRPFGNNFKPLLGIETRNSKLSKLEYWSPAEGYGSALMGMTAEWQETDWNFFASAQVGTRLYGEAGTSWSLSSGGKLWLNKDWAVGVRLWSMASQRNLQRYRSQSAHLTVEKLWD